MPRPLDRHVRTASVLALALAAGLAAPAWAQDRPVSIAASTFSGRDFGGIKLPLEPVKGAVSFSAARASVWTDGESAGETQRLFLSGDVRVKLGTYDLAAARAVVWIERIEDSRQAGVGPDKAPGVYQIYVYFDRVGDPLGQPGVALAADRLPVRAVLDVAGAIAFKADLVREERPSDAFVNEAERVFSASLDRIASGDASPPTALAFSSPGVSVLPVRDPATDRPYRPAPDIGIPDASKLADAAALLGQGEENRPIFAKNGLITIAPGELTLVTGPSADGTVAEGEMAVLATGGVVVQYVEPRGGRVLQLQAGRAVIFLASKVADPTRVMSEQVRGIYLEGEVVATDGKYTLRGSKIYYDVTQNKAVVLNAVFWTYDEERRLPLYVRAEAIRQQSQTEFTATKARLSTSAFFVPEFSIGAESVTISRQMREVIDDGQGPNVSRAGIAFSGGNNPDDVIAEGTRLRAVNLVDASGITLRAAGVPFFYLPTFTGDVQDFPLKDVRVENTNGTGTALKTRWNLYSLLGYERSDQTQVDLLLQEYFNRGPAAGIDASWKLADSTGKSFLYALPEDRGRDLMKPGTKIDAGDTFRGIALVEQRWTLDDHWSFFVEGSYISDERFIDAFLEQYGETRREFASGATLTRTEENVQFGVQAKGTFNDFIANEYLLQSQGYSVQKLPEITYLRQSDRILTESWLGGVDWFQEYRFSRMNLEFDRVTAAQHGFTDTTLSQQALGINPSDTIASKLRGEGYFENTVYRADTRQEFSKTYEVGAVKLEPFAVGRATYWDNDFSKFSPQEQDSTRLWGSGGARASTQLTKIDDSAHSSFFDVDKIRHIIEPNATVWSAGTNVHHNALPVYDQQVEALAEGTMTRVGVDQVWQTKRGIESEPGRSHSVDLFKLNTDVVFSTKDTDKVSPIGRWFDSRPEYSNPGNYFIADGLWQVSSAVAVTGSDVYDLDQHQQARNSVGAIIQHDPSFETFGELHYLNPLNSTIANFGFREQITPKYAISGNAAYDLSNGGFQGVGGEVRRSFETINFGVNLSYNNITNTTSFGFVLRPKVVARRERLRLLDSETPQAETELTR